MVTIKGLPQSLLVEEALQMMQAPLAEYGYLFSPDPPVTSYQFWFEKSPQSPDVLYRIIEFQPSRFSREDIIDLAVNLARRPYRDFNNPPEQVQENVGPAAGEADEKDRTFVQHEAACVSGSGGTEKLAPEIRRGKPA